MAWNIERRGTVAVVGMNTNKVNAQNEAFFRDLDQAFDRLEREFADCAVVLASEGKAFSAGLDFEEVFGLFGSRDAERIQEWFGRYVATNLRVFTYPRPVVAAVAGAAIAGGLITALDCDYRVGVEGENRYALNEVPIGIPMPAAYLEIIRHAVGSRSAGVISLFGRFHSTAEALALGLVHELAPREQVLERAVARAAQVPPDAFVAYASTKRALQAPALARIEGFGRGHDARIGATICNDGSLRALAAQYERVKGAAPAWRPR